MEPFKPNSALTYDKPASLKTNSSALVQALVSTPAVSRALSSAAANKDRVAVTRTQKEMTVSGSGSFGFDTDTDNGFEGVLIVGVTAQKLLSDGGKTDRAIFLSELLAETARLESKIAFDQALQQILEAYIARSTASEVDRITCGFKPLTLRVNSPLEFIQFTQFVQVKSRYPLLPLRQSFQVLLGEHRLMFRRL